MKEFNINEIDHKRVLGRNGFDEARKEITLFWGGAALEVNVKAREVYACFSAAYENLEIWVTVEINGVSVSRFMIEKEKRNYCLARNLNPEKENLITIIRDIQPMNEDSQSVLTIHSVLLDDNGDFCPILLRPLSIEFVGDSITAGEGLAGGPEEMDWISLWMRASQTYAIRLAKMMNADWNTIGKCGWGLCWSWDNNRNFRIPPHYEKVCSVLNDELSISLGAHQTWDFNDDRGSDFVIINLGTNDESGMHFNGAFPTKAQTDEITHEVSEFLRLVRSHNPSAKIIWCWGLLELKVVPACIQKGVEEYKEASGDKNVFAVELEPAEKLEKNPLEKGSRGHPGLKTHQAAATKLFEFIKSLTSVSS